MPELGVNIQFAAAWLRAFTSSPNDVVTFYDDEFDFADPPQNRFIRNDLKQLKRVIRPLSNKNPDNGLGVHRLEAIEYLGDQNAGLVHWRWSIEHADRVYGIDAGRRPVQTTGMSYHIYRHGKILREIVYSDQIRVACSLGLPVHRGRDAREPFGDLRCGFEPVTTRH
jgi:steroid delta-isomerase-like uncharacterized protein